ncbi:MAG: hypothetical protein ACOCTM_03715 [Bacteroidota bacterium]
MGVCPTDPEFREYRFNQLRELLSNYELNGIWMDYVHWHAQFEEPEPILPETCFCDNCLKNFSPDVMMFTTHAVAEDESKIKVMKEVYNQSQENRYWQQYSSPNAWTAP